MRRSYTLTASVSSQSINVDFEVVSVVVSNPTASPVYVRTGAPDIPDSGNANVIIPAAHAQSFPVGGRSFGFAIGSVSLLTGAAPALSGLFSTVTITLLDASEVIPSYGSYSFLSLSTSDLSGGLVAFAGATVTGAYDLGAWGGAILTVLPSTASGQGRVSVNVSSDGSAYRVLGEWAFWPGVPMTLTLPRTVRYMRFSLAVSGIAGEPALAGSYAVRATLAEVTAINHAPSSAPISKAYTIAALGTQSYTLATAGLQSISVTLKRATGSAAQLLVESSSSAAGPWIIASNREQILAGGLNDSIYRSIGNLDLFTRITINEIANTAMTGTFTAVIPSDVDTTSLLTSIHTAIGDQGQTPNVGQSVFHQLANLNTATGTAGSTAADTSVIGQLLKLLVTAGTAASASGANDLIGLLKAIQYWVQQIGNPGDTTASLSLIGKLLGILASLGAAGSASGANDVIGQLKAVNAVSGTTATGRNAANFMGQLQQIAYGLTAVSSTAGVPDTVLTGVIPIGTIFDAAASNTVIGRLKTIANQTFSIVQTNAALTAPASTTGGLPDNVFTELDFMRTGFTTLYNTMITSLASIVTQATNTANNTVDIVNTPAIGTATCILAAPNNYLMTAALGTCKIRGFTLSTNTTGLVNVGIGPGGGVAQAIWRGFMTANQTVKISFPNRAYIQLNAAGTEYFLASHTTAGALVAVAADITP